MTRSRGSFDKSAELAKPETEDMTETAQLKLIARFAHSVAKRGSNALLIRSDNRGTAWIPIDEAVASGQAFAVQVDEDVIAADADSPNQSRVLEHELLPCLREYGFRPVVVASGRSHHRHLFVRAMNSDARRQIVEKARELGIECRKVIRPPLAPHRLGCKVRLIYPVNAEEALDSLRRSYSHQHRQGPSDRILDLLCNGDPAGRYKTRSEVVMAITAGWVNAALSKSSLTEALLNPRNFGGAKVREIASTQGIGAAERYVARGYDKAQTFVNRRPPIRRDTAINHILDQLLRAISSLSWRGLSGANDRCVLEAHLAIARNCSRSTYRASVREIAERAGLDSVSTVSRSHKRLIKRGILRLDKLAKVGIPDVWTLSVPKESGGTFLPHLGGVRQNVPAVSLNHDVWRYQALGHSTSLVWLELDPYRGRAAQEVARIRDLTVQTVRHHLAKLQKHGLVRRGAGELWLRVERDLDEVASELGTRGNGQRQRNRHVRERELFFNQLKRQTGRIGATQ